MEQQKENAATLAGHGAKNSIEAAKLLDKYAMGGPVRATHFWCRYSNSVQPIAFMMAEGWA